MIPDKDLIVPGSSITEISNKIQVNIGKADLITTLYDNVENPKEIFKRDKPTFVPKDVSYQLIK